MTSYTQAYTLYVESQNLMKQHDYEKALNIIIKSCGMYVDLLKVEKKSDLKKSMSEQANVILSKAEQMKHTINDDLKVAALINEMPSIGMVEEVEI
jgi:hypothetical protein